MSIKFTQVDAFTAEPFKGNPAAICILDKAKDDLWMQNVAKEMNLSETAFLLKEGDSYNLRWFTPNNEVKLCGHATLASAHVLWESDYEKIDSPIHFNTKSGLLTATGKGNWIELNFPIERDRKVPPPTGLIEALGVEPLYVGKNRMDYIAEVDSEKTLRSLNPDLNLLKNIDTRGVIVTSPSDSGDYDFISRFFAPGAGIDEDPVTGSSHCCLAPFWKQRIKKEELKAYQASERGGVLKVRVDKDRVFISGQAVTVLKGEILF